MRDTVAGNLAVGLDRFLGHWLTRLGLTFAIIASLVPAEFIRTSDHIFLWLFGVEFGVRMFLLFREETQADRPEDDMEVRGGWCRPTWRQGRWVALDFVALLAFLPPEWFLAGASSARAFRLFRLARLLVLIRIWAPMARDLYSVLLRAERLKQIGLMVLASVVLSFSGAVIIDQVGDQQADFDGDGEVGDADDEDFVVRLWWSFRQIEDPGNLLANPAQGVMLGVSMALTIFGLFLVSFLIGLGTDVVRELMSLSRLRAPGLTGHTVVLNITPATRQVLIQLFQHYDKLAPEGVRWTSLEGAREILRAIRRRRQFLVVGAPEDPPEFLRAPEFARVVYRQAPPGDDALAMIRRTDLKTAKRVVMLADVTKPEPDDATIRAMLNLVVSMQKLPSEHPRPRLIAEMVDEASVGAARRATASWRFVDPKRALTQVVTTEHLVALFLANVTRWPSAERLLLELLTSKGWEIYTYSFDYPSGKEWGRRAPIRLSRGACHDRVASYRPDDDHRRTAPLALGFLTHAAPAGDEGPAQLQAHFGPTLPETTRADGLIMLAPNFREVREAVEEARESDGGDESAAEAASVARTQPTLTRCRPHPIARILVCGIRNGSVDLLESVAITYPEAHILFLVGEAERNLARAVDDLGAHRGAVLRKEGRARDGYFEPAPEGGAGRFRYRHASGAVGATLDVARGDWSSSRVLTDLPRGFGSAVECDAVVLCVEESRQGDARTMTALMKLEALSEATRGQTLRGILAGQRVVVEVDDEDLALRLRQRFQLLGAGGDGGHAGLELAVSVYALPALRAYFMFQSVVVPHFDLVFEELLGPWGKSLVPLQLAGESADGDMVSYGALARAVEAHGGRMVGFEGTDAAGQPLFWVGRPSAGTSATVPCAGVRRVWAVIDDPSRVAGDRA